jgi:DNA mismatch repair protein MutS
MPAAVLHHARHTLSALENHANQAQAQIDLFATPTEFIEETIESIESIETVAPSAVDTRLAAINLDTISPREALDILYELKSLLKE